MNLVSAVCRPAGHKISKLGVNHVCMISFSTPTAAVEAGLMATATATTTAMAAAAAGTAAAVGLGLAAPPAAPAVATRNEGQQLRPVFIFYYK